MRFSITQRVELSVTNKLIAGLVLLLFFTGACKKTDSAEPTNDLHGQMTVDGLTREWDMYIPESYDGTEEVPMILLLYGTIPVIHPYDNYYQLEQISEREGFIMCMPHPTFNTSMGLYIYNVGGFAEDLANNVDDIHFLNVMLDTMLAQYNVDAEKIYVFGHSGGSMMGYRVALEMSDRIKAAAYVAGQMIVESSGPIEPVPIIYMHGLADPKVPWEGLESPYPVPPMDSVIAKWIVWNDCNPVADTVYKTENATGVTWRSENGQSDYSLYTIDNATHDWPTEANCGFEASEFIWEFFENGSRPSLATEKEH